MADALWLICQFYGQFTPTMPTQLSSTVANS